jgi:protocatechuate 3,4-dioxygenase alpha subunit
MTITPSSTVGPYFLYGLIPSTYGGTDIIFNNLVTPDASGERIRIEGTVRDGDGVPIPDAMIEIWQADAEGRLDHAAGGKPGANAAFKGFGRTPTDADGNYAFETIRPGPVAGPNGAKQAPHIAVNVFARGMLRHLTTRIYFSDTAENTSDAILALVPAARRATLIATREDRDGKAVYRFDVRLQGEGETVFFEA